MLESELADEISITIDGVDLKTQPGTMVIQAAMDAGMYIPYLCYYPGMKPFGACRMCVVEIEGTRGSPASCTTPVADGMEVRTGTSELGDLRRGIMDLVISEHPHGCLTCHRVELCGPSDICLSGKVRYPGLYEVPMGYTLDQVVNDIGGGIPDGKALKLLQTGGPLGGVLGADSMSIKLDFDEMREAGAILGAGGIIVADEDTCAVDLTRVLVAFCQYESCGKCFPCRLGMEHLLEIVERIARCESRPGDLELMESVGTTMETTSLCGHGQLGFGPIKSAFQHFGEDFRCHIEEARCQTGSCRGPMISPKSTRPYGTDFVPGDRDAR